MHLTNEATLHFKLMLNYVKLIISMLNAKIKYKTNTKRKKFVYMTEL